MLDPFMFLNENRNGENAVKICPTIYEFCSNPCRVSFVFRQLAARDAFRSSSTYAAIGRTDESNAAVGIALAVLTAWQYDTSSNSWISLPKLAHGPSSFLSDSH